jgi:hypothetical protein
VTVPRSWCLHILSDSGKPSLEDPRVEAPIVEGLGDMTPAEALQAAYDAIEERAQPLGLSFEESLERLIWQPA